MSKSLTTHLLLAGETGQYTLDLSNVIKGEKGEPGTHGTNGQKGNTGQKGVAGTDGTITEIQFAFTNNVPGNLPKSGLFPAGWDGENQPPTTLQMVAGNCAYDISTNMLYVYVPGNNAANWAKFTTPITGPQGLGGAKGSGGAKGEKGEIGVAGTNGSNGDKGVKGTEGAQGLLGSKGAKGTPGVPGDNGVNGTTGTKGNTGATGSKGNQGATGVQGTTGPQGQKGETGLSGTSGSKGEKGADASNAGGVARSHAAFSGSGIITTLSTYNISEILRLSHGTYRVRFGSKMPSINYTALAQSNVGNIKIVERGQWACILHIVNDQGQFQDSDYVALAIFHS